MDAHQNWEKNAIIADVEVVKEIKIKSTRLCCPWCDSHHLVIINSSSTVSGKHFCDHCGQFFSFIAHDGEGTTKRVLARPKKVRTEYGEKIRSLARNGHHDASVAGDYAPAGRGN